MITLYYKGSPDDTVNKVSVIKAIRALTGAGLRDSKAAMELAMDTAGAADLNLNINEDLHRWDIDRHLNTLLEEGFTVKCPYTNLINALDLALELSVKERRHAISRKILEALEELGV